MVKYRAYYKPDTRTQDWPMYFYPQDREIGLEHIKIWVCDIDSYITYPFHEPFFDSDWVIQFFDNSQWVNIKPLQHLSFDRKTADILGYL